MRSHFRTLAPLLLVTATIAAAAPPIVYVAGDGTGDFNCDGRKDHVEINEALNFVAENDDYTTVYLKGPNTYLIDATIFISANTILEGDADAAIKLVNHARWWKTFKPLIAQKGARFGYGLGDPSTTTGNITIRGFEIDGNRDKQREPSGWSYYGIIQLQNCYNVTINDMYLHDNLGDAMQLSYDLYGFDVNARTYDNRVHDDGHDAIYLGNVQNFEVFDNVFTNNRTDAGVRAQHCNHFKIHDNIIGNDPDYRFSGGAAIQIEADGDTPLTDAEIYGNYCYGHGAYHGIWPHHENGGGALDTHRDVHIHHNVVSWYNLSAIGICGFHNTLIENNVLENNLIDGGTGGGVSFYDGDPVNPVSGFRTIVRNNIVFENATYGLDNQRPDIHAFISDYNCIYGNALGHYNNASSTTDIHAAPEFGRDFLQTYGILSLGWMDAAESGDLGAVEAWSSYHLRSRSGRWDGTQWLDDALTSACVNAGDPLADYANEPSPNGGRINVGAFGNTEEASKGVASGVVNVELSLGYQPPASR
jgi:hypothetical protein